MKIPARLPGLLVPFSPTAILILAAPLIGACSPICETVNTWTWGICYADIHGNDASGIRSELDEPPAVGHAGAVGQARRLVRDRLVEDNLPGLSVAVAVGGDIVWAEGFGWADIEQRRPVTPRTRFRIGSVAETMTAAAVGLLMERGALDIDVPVRRFVPGYPEKRWPFTTRELMGDAAGVGHYVDDDEMLYLRASCAGPLDALRLYAEDPLRFEPGTDYARSIHGWMLVGAVVESAAGVPFLEFMQREVFGPLAMNETALDDRARPQPQTTSFYWPFAARDTTTGIENANDPDNTCLQGAAALLSTPSDVVKFGAALLDGRLIRAGTLDTLLTPLALASGESTGHALGWFVQRVPVGPGAESTTVIGHDSRSAGGTTSFLAVPGHEVVIALTANVSYARHLSSLAARLADLFVTTSQLDPANIG